MVEIMTGLDNKWLSMELDSIEQQSQHWSDAMRAAYAASLQTLAKNTYDSVNRKKDLPNAVETKAA